jgi:hypothetical protein
VRYPSDIVEGLIMGDKFGKMIPSIFESMFEASKVTFFWMIIQEQARELSAASPISIKRLNHNWQG